jgi:dienelactone hydrolase
MSVSPSLLSRATWFIALALSAVATAAAAQETVHFTSLDGTTSLTTYLSRPPGAAQGMQDDTPRPALVLLHGCSGLVNRSGRISPLYRAWIRTLLAKGYVVLAVDSATSRGFGQTCSPSQERTTMWRDRPKDAYAALQYLQAQPFVQGDHVGLMGWSQGGGVVLLSINDKSIGRPVGLAHEFRAAVSFYPGACSETAQSKPYTQVEPGSWATSVPLLLLMGEADTWTPFKPCAAFLEAAKTRGSPVEIKSYPSAVHAFDAPDLERRELPAYRTGDGPIPVIATDDEARADAVLRVLAFLKARLD